MKAQKFITLLFSFLLFQVSNVSATIFTSAQDGKWSDSTSWTPYGVPGPADQVLIYDSIYVNTDVSVGNIQMFNSNRSAYLVLTGSITLNCIGSFTATAANQAFNLEIQLRGTSNLIVGDIFTMTREADNLTPNSFRFKQMGGSKAIFNSDFNFNYFNSGEELTAEVFLADSSTLEIFGKSTFTISNGKVFSIHLSDSSRATFNDIATFNGFSNSVTRVISDSFSNIKFVENVQIKNTSAEKVTFATGELGGSMNIEKNVFLTSSVAGADLSLRVRRESSNITIGGDLNINAAASQNLGIIIDSGYVALAGAIYRNTAFGYIDMGKAAKFILNGNTAQSIPQKKLVGSELDSLNITNIVINNSSGAPITLTEDFIIGDTLELSDANLISASWAQLILTDSAVVKGGSSDAYIEGPVLKKGRTGPGGLFLPVGSSDRYAPISFSQINDINSEITVQYLADPPPFGNDNNEPGLNNIMLDGYWNVNRNEKSGELDVTLHWADAGNLGINDLSSMVVAGLEGPEHTGTVVSYGQESTSGGIGSGTGGSVTSAFADPPPFGTQNFVFGSTSALNSLPVELTKFSAIQKGKEVYLQWETSAEDDASHFVIEHSVDGDIFDRFDHKSNTGQGNSIQFYNTTHFQPKTGMNYYRLKIVDQNGSFEYSHVELVDFNPEANLSIYPNPVDKYLNIKGTENFKGETTIEVFDQNGRLLFIGEFEIDESEIQIPTEKLNVNIWGNYFIRMTQGRKSQVLKFIKLD